MRGVELGGRNGGETKIYVACTYEILQKLMKKERWDDGEKHDGTERKGRGRKEE